MKTGTFARVVLADLRGQVPDAGLDASLAEHQLEGVTVDCEVLSPCSPSVCR